MQNLLSYLTSTNYTQQALIDIAQLLNRDTTTPITPLHDEQTIRHSNKTSSVPNIPSEITLPQSTSDRAIASSSEGGPPSSIAPSSEGEACQLNYQQIPTSKTTIQLPSTDHIPKHPQLHLNTSPVTSNISSPPLPSQRRPSNLTPRITENIDSIIKEFPDTPSHPTHRSPRLIKAIPHAPYPPKPTYVSFPTSYKPKSTKAQARHTMHLRGRHILPTPYVNYKCRAAQ